MTAEDLLESAITRVAERTNSWCGWTENEDVDYREFCIYVLEQKELDEELNYLNAIHNCKVEYEIVEQFIDGNGDECIYFKVKE